MDYPDWDQVRRRPRERDAADAWSGPVGDYADQAPTGYGQSLSRRAADRYDEPTGAFGPGAEPGRRSAGGRDGAPWLDHTDTAGFDPLSDAGRWTGGVDPWAADVQAARDAIPGEPAAWRSTTETSAWRSTTETASWRTTTEAWRTTTERAAWRPTGDSPALEDGDGRARRWPGRDTGLSQPAITGTAWSPNGDPLSASGRGGAGERGTPEAGPYDPTRPYAPRALESGSYGTGPYSPTGYDRGPDITPRDQSAGYQQPPSWSPGPDDRTRPGTASAWGPAASGTPSSVPGRRRAPDPEDPRPVSGTGRWGGAAEAAGWVAQTDTGFVPRQSGPEAGGWRPRPDDPTGTGGWQAPDEVRGTRHRAVEDDPGSRWRPAERPTDPWQQTAERPTDAWQRTTELPDGPDARRSPGEPYPVTGGWRPAPDVRRPAPAIEAAAPDRAWRPDGSYGDGRRAADRRADTGSWQVPVDEVSGRRAPDARPRPGRRHAADPDSDAEQPRGRDEPWRTEPNRGAIEPWRAQPDPSRVEPWRTEPNRGAIEPWRAQPDPSRDEPWRTEPSRGRGGEAASRWDGDAAGGGWRAPRGRTEGMRSGPPGPGEPRGRVGEWDDEPRTARNPPPGTTDDRANGRRRPADPQGWAEPALRSRASADRPSSAHGYPVHRPPAESGFAEEQGRGGSPRYGNSGGGQPPTDARQAGRSAAPMSGIPMSGIPMSGIPMSAEPRSGIPASGIPRSGVPMSGIPVSTEPMSGIPMSGIPMSSVPMSGTPISAEPMSGVPMSGVPMSGVPMSAVPMSGIPVSAEPMSGVPMSGIPLSAPPDDRRSGSWAAAPPGSAPPSVARGGRGRGRVSGDDFLSARPRQQLLVPADRDDRTGAESSSYPRRSAAGSAPYARRVGREMQATAARQRPSAIAYDELYEDQQGGPAVAMGYTLVWYGVPVVLAVVYMLFLDPAQRVYALTTLSGAAPQFGISMALSLAVAVGLRRASGTWRPVSVGLAAAVMGGGLATVLMSAITGQALG